MTRILIVLSFLLVSCSSQKKTREKILKLINSKDQTDLIKGFALIGDTKDTFFVRAIFSNPGDSRISNNLYHQGISVYEAKMFAIKQITGVEPPTEISYRVDTSIINFYINVAKEQHLLN
jgi:hypothetical protein